MKMKTWTSVVVIAAVSLAAVFCFGCVKDDSRGLLGIVVPVGKDRVTQSSPYIVTGVYEGSPAYDAGIRPDDVIVMIDGRAVEGLEYDYIYNNLLRGRAGTRVRIAVMRKAQKLEFDVVRGL